MLEEYFPVLMFIGVAMAIGVVPVMAGMFLGPTRPDPQKKRAL